MCILFEYLEQFEARYIQSVHLNFHDLIELMLPYNSVFIFRLRFN